MKFVKSIKYKGRTYCTQSQNVDQTIDKEVEERISEQLIEEIVREETREIYINMLKRIDDLHEELKRKDDMLIQAFRGKKWYEIF